MKKIYGLVLVLLCIVVGIFLLKSKNNKVIAPIIKSNPTNFVELGVIAIDNPGLKPGVPYLIYEKSGVPALTKELIIDEQSVCAAESGGIPCVAMSVDQKTFTKNRRFTIEGLKEGVDAVRVRVMRVISEREEVVLPVVGSEYVSWPEAIKLVEGCNVESLMQFHSGKVSMKTKNGDVLLTIEPVIDEIMRVANENQTKCGSIVLGTE